MEKENKKEEISYDIFKRTLPFPRKKMARNKWIQQRKKKRINENELSNIGELSTSRLELNGKGRNESV